MYFETLFGGDAPFVGADFIAAYAQPGGAATTLASLGAGDGDLVFVIIQQSGNTVDALPSGSFTQLATYLFAKRITSADLSSVVYSRNFVPALRPCLIYIYRNASAFSLKGSDTTTSFGSARTVAGFNKAGGHRGIFIAFVGSGSINAPSGFVDRTPAGQTLRGFDRPYPANLLYVDGTDFDWTPSAGGPLDPSAAFYVVEMTS